MPSPFPGMDPYLEDPAVWPGVHSQLINAAARRLSAQLLPKYIVRPDVRVYVSDEYDPGRGAIIPDVRITLSGSPARRKRPRRAAATTRGANARTAVAEVAQPVEMTILIDDEISESRLLIKNVVTREVVTVIEILSPSNKVSGARGRDSYAEKRQQVMASASHFVEIDLLRAGHRFGPNEELGPHQYLVNVSRAERRPRATLWPIRLDQRLPTIPVPVLPGDPDATLDLQTLLTEVYDGGGYQYEIDYTQEPVPRLPPTWKRWADQRLRPTRKR
jgi:hypothetical protein